MHPSPIRVVVIGTGGIGKYHLRLWAEMPDVAVAGVFDTNPAVAKAAAEQFGVPHVYDSLDAAVGDTDVEIVDVCTPNMFHQEAVIAALQAGRHCLCEKPLAIDPADIEAMIAARDAAGKLLCTIQHMRFEPRTQALKRLIDHGRLGDVYYTRAWWLRRRGAPATPGFLSRAHAGRGPGADLGVHMLDLILYLLNFPTPTSVTGFSCRKLAQQPNLANEWGVFDPASFEVEEFALGLIRFANNSVLSLEVSWLLNMIDKETHRLWLHGTRAGAEWPNLRLAQCEDGVLLDSAISSNLGGDGHKHQLRAFLDAVRYGRPSPVPTEQSLTVARLLETLYQSAECQQEIQLA